MRRLLAWLTLALAACSSSGASSTPDADLSRLDAVPSTPDAPQQTPDAGQVTFGQLTTAIVSQIPQPQVTVEVNDPTRMYYFTLTPRDLGVGDLDGDGNVDILFAPSMFNAKPELPIQIWCGGGDGTFAPCTDRVIAGAAPVVGSINNEFLADFNGDHRLDVFLVDQGLEYPVPLLGSRNKLLLSGTDGRLHDASAALPVDYNSFNHVSSMADMNVDGCPDIVVTTFGGPALTHHGSYILYGDCHGGFTHSIAGMAPEVAEEPNTYTTGIDYQTTGTNGTGDLDGDGRPELVTASYRSTDFVSGKKTILVHKNLPGSYARTTVVPFPAALNAVPYLPGEDPGGTPFGLGAANLVIGDIDGDGRAEIVVNWEGAQHSTIQILRNEGGLSFTDATQAIFGGYDTTFQTSTGFTTFAQRTELRDVDGDGRLDLILTYYGIGASELASRGFLYLNDGAGRLLPWHFQRGGRAATESEVAASFPGTSEPFERAGIPLVLDANGDGVNDIAILSGGPTHGGPPIQTERIFIYTFLAGRR